MKKELIEIKCFVPALALEWPLGLEGADLKDKLRKAVLRFHLTEDFFGDITVQDPIPFVILDEYKFIARSLGYEVIARVKSG